MLVKQTICTFSSKICQRVGQNRSVSCSAPLFAILPKPPPDRMCVDPTKNNQLRDAADYSFLDGRPTPYGVGQVKRIQRQLEHTEKIVRYAKEVDYAKAEWAARQQADGEVIQDRIARKLKPKGKNLISLPRASGFKS